MLNLLSVNDYSNPAYIGSRFRKKRFQFFESRLRSFQKPITILDIGGTVNFWVNENYHNRYDRMITVLNLEAEESNYVNIRTLQADACDLSRFNNQAFDISFSNSLIEHLYTKQHQQKMAEEAMRVGKYYFIQTPNKYFPVEPHFKLPFFQFLPRFCKLFLLTQTCLVNGAQYEKNYAENFIDEIRLLAQTEFQALFPGCTLYEEKFMGLTKSLIAHNLPEPSFEISIQSFQEEHAKLNA